jgi:acyl-CoA synthetase (AMP-forming)/AMP-acid ligase II
MNPAFSEHLPSLLALNLMTDRAAKTYSKLVPHRKTSANPTYVIALLGSSNLEYLTSYLALQRLGLTTLFLSTRLADPAFEHLLRTCKCSHVIAQNSFHPAMRRIREKITYLKIYPLIDFATITAPRSELDRELLDIHIDPAQESGKPSHIIHSSGSTGVISS